MSDTFKQYSTATSGTVSIQNTKQNVQLVHDAVSLAVTLTVTFPSAPIDGQTFGFCSTLGVTTLTLSSGLSIIGGVSTIAAGGFATWIYDVTANKWFRFS